MPTWCQSTRFDLADFGGVDVEMRDVLRVAARIGRVARDAIVKARADGDQEIAVLDGVVRGGDAVHAEHVQASGCVVSLAPSAIRWS